VGNAEGAAEMERAREIRSSTVDVGIDENIGCGTQKRPVDLSRVEGWVCSWCPKLDNLGNSGKARGRCHGQPLQSPTYPIRNGTRP